MSNPKHDECYHLAKKRFRIFPSAYSSGYIAKCRKAKKLVRKTKSGNSLRRWYKEKWKTSDGRPCGYRTVKVKKCRPSVRISQDTPVTWSELTPTQKRKIVEMKRKIGMGKRAPSIRRIRRIRRKKVKKKGKKILVI